MPAEFNVGDPIAYFLTWTTYGTWLPGDPRGWNRKGEIDSLTGNSLIAATAKARMREDVFLLTISDRKVVEETIGDHCEIRGWELHALNVRSNHLHVVVTAGENSPEKVVAELKTWCTRKLKEAHEKRNRFWTQGASCRWLNSDDDLAKAVDYTNEAQDRKGVE